MQTNYKVLPGDALHFVLRYVVLRNCKLISTT